MDAYLPIATTQIATTYKRPDQHCDLYIDAALCVCVFACVRVCVRVRKCVRERERRVDPQAQIKLPAKCFDVIAST